MLFGSTSVQLVLHQLSALLWRLMENTTCCSNFTQKRQNRFFKRQSPNRNIVSCSTAMHWNISYLNINQTTTSYESQANFTAQLTVESPTSTLRGGARGVGGSLLAIKGNQLELKQSKYLLSSYISYCRGNLCV